MKFAGKNYLYLLIFGITLIGCLLLPNFKAKTEIYTGSQTAEVLYITSDMKDWIVINENVLPNIPGRIYVLKTESRAEIWHTNAITRSENGELSERQKLNLLNTGKAPKGWEVIYVDEAGSSHLSEKIKRALRLFPTTRTTDCRAVNRRLEISCPTH